MKAETYAQVRRLQEAARNVIHYTRPEQFLEGLRNLEAAAEELDLFLPKEADDSFSHPEVKDGVIAQLQQIVGPGITIRELRPSYPAPLVQVLTNLGLTPRYPRLARDPKLPLVWPHDFESLRGFWSASIDRATLGDYDTPAPWVGSWWTPGGDELAFSDGALTNVGQSPRWRDWLEFVGVLKVGNPHAQVALDLLGSSEEEPGTMLLANRVTGGLVVGPFGDARRHLEAQWEQDTYPSDPCWCCGKSKPIFDSGMCDTCFAFAEAHTLPGATEEEIRQVWKATQEAAGL